MRSRILLVCLGLVIFLLTFTIFLNRDLAIGQNPEGASPAPDMQSKLDQIITSQQLIMDKLDSLQGLLSHEIKVRCTP
jgi:hypothetical protein